MAEATAAIRLTLKDSGFTRTFRSTARDVKSQAKGMGTALRTSLRAGAKGGLDAVRGMASAIKGQVMQLGGLLGGIGFGALVKGAVDADQQFRKLSFTMGAGAGKFRDHQQLMAKSRDVAVRWGQSNEDLAAALDEVFNTVGDADFSLAQLETMAVAARASGEELATIAPIVAEMNRQFGLTSEEIADALPRILSLGSRGGLSVADLGSNLGKLGRTAKVAGFEGQDGMAALLAMVNQISAASGNAEGSVEKLQIIFTKLAGSGGSAFLQTVKDSAGKNLFSADVETLTTLERLQAVIDKAQTNPESFMKVFGEQGVFIEQAFGGMKDVAGAMAEASQSAMTAADLQERARNNMKSAGAGIDVALETLKAAFSKPQMMSAINKLADNLPALAEAVAKAVDFVVENPMLSAGVLTGAQFGRGALGAMFGGGAGGAPGVGGVAGGAPGGGPGGGKIGNPSELIAAGGTAAVAWMGVYEQWTKLAKDVGASGDGFFKTLGKAWDAATDGVEERQRSMSDERYEMARAQGAGPSLERDRSVLQHLGITSGEQRYRVSRSATTGKVVRDEVASVDVEDNLSGLAARIQQQLQQQLQQASFQGPPIPANQGPQQQQQDRDLKVKMDPAAAAAQGRATGAAISQRELRVRITNPEDIRGAGGGADGTTPPGRFQTPSSTAPPYFPRQ